MKIDLNVSERLFAIGILNQFKGNYETLSFILTDIKELVITDKDWGKAERKVNITKDDKGKEMTSWTWNDDKGGVKSIELSPRVVEYLISDIETKNKAGEFTLQDKAVITLNEKLIKAK